MPDLYQDPSVSARPPVPDPLGGEDHYGFGEMERYLEGIRNYQPPDAVAPPDTRTNMERDFPAGWKPLTAEEMRGRGTGYRGLDLTSADYANARAEQIIQEHQGKLLGTAGLTNPIISGIANSGLNTLQTAALPLHLFGADASGAIMDEQRARALAADKLRGQESTGEGYARKITTAIADVLSVSRTLKGAGMAPAAAGKTYLALMGARSYDMSLKQGQESGLSGAENHAFAGANAAAEVLSETLMWKLGKGVMGKMFPKPVGVQPAVGAVREVLKKTIGQRLLDVGKTAGEEGIEEGVTQIAQNANEMLHGIKPPSVGGLFDGVGEAMLVGAAAGGGIGGGANVREGLQQRQAEGEQAVQSLVDSQQSLVDQNAARVRSTQVVQRITRRRAAEGYVADFVAGRSNDQIAKLAALDESEPQQQTRTQFAKAAGIDRDAVPRPDIRDGILKAAAARHAAQSPAPLPGWQSPAEGTSKPVLNPATSADEAITGDVRAKEKPWHHGVDISPTHRQELSPLVEDAKHHGVDPGRFVQATLDEYHSELQGHDMVMAIRREVGRLDPTMRKLLENSDQDAIQKAGITWDSKVSEFLNSSVGGQFAGENGEERVKDALKLHKDPPRPGMADVGSRVLRQMANNPEAFQQPPEVHYGDADDSMAPDNQPVEVAPGVMFRPQVDQLAHESEKSYPVLETIKKLQGNEGAPVTIKELRAALPGITDAELLRKLQGPLKGAVATHNVDPAIDSAEENRLYDKANGRYIGTVSVRLSGRKIGLANQTTKPQGPVLGMAAAASPPKARPVTTGGQPRAGGVRPHPEATLASTGQKKGIIQRIKDKLGFGGQRLEELAGRIADVGETVTGKKGRVGVGRLTNKRSLAQYHTGLGSIRLGEFGDLTSLSHEVGHKISENTDILQGLSVKEIQELTRLGKAIYPKETGIDFLTKEGYSEYLRMRLTGQGDAQAEAPEFHKRHEAFLATRPDVRKAVDHAVEGAHEWFRVMGAQERAASQLRNPHSFSDTLRKRWEQAKGLFSRESWDDLAHPLHEFYKDVQRVTGNAAVGGKNAWEKFKVYRSTFSGRINQFMEWGQFDRQHPDVKTGKSLDEILKPVSDTQERSHKFDLYLFALSSDAYWQTGKNPGISKDDTQQLLNELRGEPGFAGAANELEGWIKSVNEYIGSFDATYAEQFKQASGAYTFYMPHKRIIELAEGYARDRGGQAGAGGAASGRISAKRRGGGYLPLREQLPQLVDDKAAQLRRAMQRDVTKTLIRSIYSKSLGGGQPFAGFSQLIDEIKIPITVKHKTGARSALAEIESVLGVKLGIDPGSMTGVADPRQELLDQLDRVESMGADEIAFFGKADNPAGPDNVMVWKTRDANGKMTPRWFVVQPKMERMLSGIEPAQLKGLLGGIFATSTRLIKTGAIGFSPRFGLVRNAQRDMIDMLVKMPGGKNPVNAARALGQYFNVWARALSGAVGLKADTSAMHLARTLGLEGSHLLSEHLPTSSKLLAKLRQTTTAKWFSPSNWLDGFSQIISSSEMAGRATAAQQRLDALGWKPGNTMDVNTEIAFALAYKETMGDYTAKGEAMRYADLVIPFASTPITYGRSMAQALFPTGKITQPNLPAFAAGFTYLMGPTIAVWLYNKDEDWYKNLSPAEKYGRVLIKVPGQNTAFMWNRNSEGGILFSALPEALLSAWYQQDPQAATEFARFAVTQMSPDLLPPIAMEALRQASNKEDITSGRPIVPGREGIDQRPLPEQFTEGTSETAKSIGGATGLSPLRIEHAADRLTGGLARRLTSTIEGATGIKPATREQQLSDLPVVGAVLPSGGLAGNRPKPIEKLYELDAAARQKQHSIEHPETEEDKAQRLMLNAATRVVGGLMKERAKEETAAGREVLMDRATKLAGEAADAGPKERARFLGLAAGIEYRLEPDEAVRARALYGRLEQLSDSKPKIGRGGVTKENLERRMQGYLDQRSSGRAFLDESGVTNANAVKAFKDVITHGLGAEKTGRIKSPEVRVLRVRRLRQELGSG